jgi:hypothetical protein
MNTTSDTFQNFRRSVGKRPYGLGEITVYGYGFEQPVPVKQETGPGIGVIAVAVAAAWWLWRKYGSGKGGAQ